MTLTPEQVASFRTQAGLSPTPPAPASSGTSNILAQRKAALGMSDTPAPAAPQTFAQRVGADVSNAGKQVQSTLTDTTKNPIQVGVEATGAAMHAIPAVASEALPEPARRAISDIGTGLGHDVNSIGEAINKIPGFTDLINSHPDAVNELMTVLKTGQAAGGLAGDILTTGEGTDLAQKGLNQVPKVIDATGKVASNVADTASDAVNAVKNKIAPAEPVDTTVGKVLQGKTGDIASGKSALSDLDTSKVKTYKDLNTASSAKIKELATQQDTILSQDKTPHPLKEFEKTTGTGDNAVKTNYVKQAIDNLKELYSSTADAKGMSQIQELETKANGEGLTTQEVNKLARQYGTEFKSKAFAKVSGDPLTSVNAQKFENIRTGLKNTARDFLPDDASRALDQRISDQYTVKDLSGKMTEKVNTLTQRLQKVNALQKLGGIVGKGLKITGIGDLASKLLGIDKVPGAATLNPVELEGQLSKNLAKINRAMEGSDANFVDTIKGMVTDYIKEPKLGASVKDISTTPEKFAQNMDSADKALVKKYLENPSDLDAYMEVQPVLEGAKLDKADPKVVDKFLQEVMDIANQKK